MKNCEWYFPSLLCGEALIPAFLISLPRVQVLGSMLYISLKNTQYPGDIINAHIACKWVQASAIVDWWKILKVKQKISPIITDGCKSCSGAVREEGHSRS